MTWGERALGRLGAGVVGRPAGAARSADARAVRVITALFGLCVLAYLATLPLPRARDDALLFHSDGVGYYAVLRSLVLDRDLDLRNELFVLAGEVHDRPVAPYYTIGMAVAWLPFYLAAHLAASLGAALGLPIRADGYHQLYQVAVCLGSMLYGYLGLRLTYSLCREFADVLAAVAAVVVVWLGWSIVYYLTIENSMSHMVSFAVVSALIAWWRLGRDAAPVRYWCGLGLLTGFAATVRPQDGLFLVLPGLSLLSAALTAVRGPRPIGVAGYPVPRKRSPGSAPPLDTVPTVRESGRPATLADVVRAGLLLAAGVALGYAPQLVASTVAYGTPLTVGYQAAGQRFFLASPRLAEVLFSTWHGLFTWHPVLLLVPVGLWLVARRDAADALALTVAWLLQVYLVASWEVWWQGDAFGSRMLINCGAIFALGLAAVFAWLRRRSGGWAVAAVVAPALVWNWLFILQYRLGYVPMSDPLTWQQLTTDKLTVVPDLLRRLLRRGAA